MIPKETITAGVAVPDHNMFVSKGNKAEMIPKETIMASAAVPDHNMFVSKGNKAEMIPKEIKQVNRKNERKQTNPNH